MNKVASIFSLLVFAGLIVGTGLVLRRFPVLATTMALGPCVVTFIGAALALATRPGREE